MNLDPKQVMEIYIALGIYSALVQSLIPPDTSSAKWYIVLYKFMSLVGQDFKSFTNSVPPPTFTVQSGGTSTVKTVVDSAVTGATQSAQTTVTDQNAGR
jgi:hypothetical protein